MLSKFPEAFDYTSLVFPQSVFLFKEIFQTFGKKFGETLELDKNYSIVLICTLPFSSSTAYSIAYI